MEWMTAGAVSFLWSWLAPKTPLAALLSDDAVDDELKVHSSPVPAIGGIGIGLGLVASLIISGDWWFNTAAVLALGLGVVDDRLGLSARVRLSVEVVIGVLVAVSVAGVGSFVEFPLAVIATVVVINAVNLYDGLDGLVGGAFLVSSLSVWMATGGTIGLALGAAIGGFLVWNWQPARLFLGDGGAYLIAVVFVYAALGGDSSFPGTLALLGLAGVVLIDLVVTLIRRSVKGSPLLAGDRSHSYDQLIDRGWSVQRVSLASASLQLVIAVVTVAGLARSDALGLVASLALSAALLVAALRAGFMSAGSANTAGN